MLGCWGFFVWRGVAWATSNPAMVSIPSISASLRSTMGSRIMKIMSANPGRMPAERSIEQGTITLVHGGSVGVRGGPPPEHQARPAHIVGIKMESNWTPTNFIVGMKMV